MLSTAKQFQADQALDGKLVETLREMKDGEGLSFEKIARRLAIETDGAIDVAGHTIRNWWIELVVDAVPPEQVLPPEELADARARAAATSIQHPSGSDLPPEAA